MNLLVTVRVAVVAAGLALGLFAESRSFGAPLVRGSDLAVGLLFVIAGSTLPVARRVESALLVTTGFVWFVGTLLPVAAVWHRAVLVHLLLVLAWRARLSRSALVVLLAGYAMALVGAIWSSDAATPWAAIAWGIATIGVASRAPSGRRRAIAITCLAALSLSILGTAVYRLFVGPSAPVAALLGYDAVLAAIAIAVWAAARGPNLGALIDTVVELGERGHEVRDRLAGLLDDPDLIIGYRDDLTDSYVDEDGRAVDETPGPGRSTHRIIVDGVPLAILIHRASGVDRSLLERAVLTAVAIRRENQRLAGEAEARLAEVAATRHRVALAGADERRRFGRELHELVTTRLAGLEHELGTARARELLRRAAAELEQLAAGLAPTVLDGGLPAALRLVAENSAARVDLDLPVGDADADMDDGVAQCLYFACAEGLANAVRHAAAQHASVRLRRAGDCWELEIRNPVIGSSGSSDQISEGSGSGLTGLRDRIEAVGGILEAGPTASGFRLFVRLPARVTTGTGPAPLSRSS